MGLETPKHWFYWDPQNISTSWFRDSWGVKGLRGPSCFCDLEARNIGTSRGSGDSGRAKAAERSQCLGVSELKPDTVYAGHCRTRAGSHWERAICIYTHTYVHGSNNEKQKWVCTCICSAMCVYITIRPSMHACMHACMRALYVCMQAASMDGCAYKPCADCTETACLLQTRARGGPRADHRTLLSWSNYDSK